MSETQVEPPVMKDGKLVVRCSYDGCNKTTEIGIDVDAVESSGHNPGWRISFIPTADGRLEVDDVECHKHRSDEMIEDLAESQRKFAKSFATTMDVVEKLES